MPLDRRATPNSQGNPSTDAAQASARVERLRALRNFEARGVAQAPMGALFAQAGRDAARDHRRLGNAGDAWAATCPEQLLGRTRIVGLSRGSLTVAVPDAATRFELDRALRSGAERALIGMCSAPVRKVRVVVTG